MNTTLTCHYKIIALHRFHPTLEMPMDKAIAGEGEGVKSGETGHYRFHLGFSKYPLS